MQEPGYYNTYVTAYNDSPDMGHTVPIVPSLLQYDDCGNPIRYGYQVDPSGPLVTRWFKLLVASDDNSLPRRKAEADMHNLPGAMDETRIVKDFLKRLFEAVRNHLSNDDVENCKFRVLGALPFPSDQIAKEDYKQCLWWAAVSTGLNDISVDLHFESVAVARSCVHNIGKPGSYLYRIHDGGGGTTQFHMMFVRISPDGTMEREEIHTSEYLSTGGESGDAAYEEMIRSRFPDVSTNQMTGFMKLWKDVLKVKCQESWSLHADIKALLPPDFILTEDFAEDLQRSVYNRVINPIVEYLRRENFKGMEVFRRLQELARSSLEQLKEKLCSRDRDIGAIEVIGIDEDKVTRSEIDNLQRLLAAYENCERKFISHGGQSADPRLQIAIKTLIGDEWQRARDPRTGVVDGLILMHLDAQQRRKLPRAQCSYGYLGWNEASQG